MLRPCRGARTAHARRGLSQGYEDRGPGARPPRRGFGGPRRSKNRLRRARHRRPSFATVVRWDHSYAPRVRATNGQAMDPVRALLDDGACEVVERPAEEDSVRRIAHDVHLQVQRDTRPVDRQGDVHGHSQGPVDYAVRRLHP